MAETDQPVCNAARHLGIGYLLTCLRATSSAPRTCDWPLALVLERVQLRRVATSTATTVDSGKALTVCINRLYICPALPVVH